MRAPLVAKTWMLSLLVSAMFADLRSLAEEIEVLPRSDQFRTPQEGEKQQVIDLRPLFREPAPGVKMVVWDFNIENALADTSERTYCLTSRDRYLEMLRAPPVVIEFDIGTEPPKEKFVTKLRGKVSQSWEALNRALLPKPSGSGEIGDKIVDAFWDAVDADQIQGFEVKLEIEHGQVILSGDVFSLEQKQRVTKIVKDVPEVQRLVNRLTVREADAK